MKLDQTRDASKVQDLPDGQEEFDTGIMADCVSVVALWDRGGDGRYRRMRGYHGGGGFRPENLNNLFDGTPETGLLVFILMGSVASKSYMIKQSGRDVMPENDFDRATKGIESLRPEAVINSRRDPELNRYFVDRHGNVTGVDGKRPAESPDVQSPTCGCAVM